MPPSTAVRLTWPQVRAFWSHRQLTGPDRSDADAATLAGRLCGVHAQYRTSAALVLGVRNTALTPSHIDDALTGELVKTWAMRGTLHLMATVDLPLYVSDPLLSVGERSRGEPSDRFALRWSFSAGDLW